MSDTKDTTSFFRKVVKFVANPATEWADLGVPTDEARENEFAKGELKAMIERKRRNDFVRKREFDMLRRVRREGLTGDQLAALGGSSRIDDSEARIVESGAKQDIGVKAKIDEIEQQMVGESRDQTGPRRTPEFYNASTQPAAMDARPSRTAPATFSGGGRLVEDAPRTRPPAPLPTSAVVMASGVAPLSTLRPDSGLADAEPALVRAAHQVAHDPELDEAVIAFANADFEDCEQALLALTRAGAPRALHADTWLVLFDLYRAIGQQPRFEALALDYAQQFGWSAPQWFSMPKLVAEAAGDERAPSAHVDGHVGWVCPEHLDADAVAQLSSVALQMPLPWVFDWSALQRIDAEACARMSDLFRNWVDQDLDMRWLNGERLFAVLVEAAPNGVHDADPAFWMLRLDALRMTNRPDQFDEAAIDYCVTYEVSPPSWEPVRCRVHISGPGTTTSSPPLSVVSDVATSFQESRLPEDASMVQVGSVELSGQLVGDIGATLNKLDAQLGTASVIAVSCALLIRVDFIAAGDLLNWVLARRGENRSVQFVQAHRIVALFFGAMGINEHATVKVGTV